MKAYLVVWGLFAILLSTVVAGFGNQMFLTDKTIDFSNLNRVNPNMVIPNSKDIGNYPINSVYTPPKYQPSVRDFSVETLSFEAPTGTEVGDYVTFIGTIKNKSPFPEPLLYSFFLNDANLGPAVTRDLNRFSDNTVIFFNPGESKVVIKSIQLTREGQNTIQLKADPFNLISEKSWSNNMKSVTLFVRQNQQQPPQNNNPSGNATIDEARLPSSVISGSSSGNAAGNATIEGMNQNPAGNNGQVQQQNNNQNSNPSGDNPSNDTPSQDNQQNNNANVSRADARDALQEAQERCEAAETVLDRAKRAIAAKESVSFSKRDVENEKDSFSDVRKEVRNADRAYDDGNYGEAFSNAESAEERCSRLISKLRINEPAPQPAPEPAPTYTVRYHQPSPTPISVAELEEEVQLIKSNVQKLVNEQPIEDDATSPLLIFGVIVGAFLVLGELVTLAYFVFRK